MFEDKKAWKSLAWKHVVTMSDSEARAAISTVLRQAGVRYVGADPAKDRKSAALVHNLRVLERAGGPRKYFRALARKKTDLERVTALCRELKSIKHKSARDLLIEIGMDQDFIAFDSRVQKVLKALGIEDASFSDAARYRELEEMFLAAVPALGVTCLGHLDRVLFHNTDAILSRLGFGTPPTGTVTIALSEETRAKLERVARKRGVALHDLARQLLESAIGSLRQ